MTRQDLSPDLEHLDAAIQAMFEEDGEALERLRLRTERIVSEPPDLASPWGFLVHPLRSPATALAYAVAVMVLVAGSAGLGTVLLTKQGPSLPHLSIPAASPAPTPLEPSLTPTREPGPYTTVEAAQQYIRDRGPSGWPLTAIQPEQTWKPGALLHVLHARYLGAADNSGDWYFFFVDGHPVGQLYFEYAKSGSVVDDTTFNLTYLRYSANDSACCPSRGQRSVRLHWDGSNLNSLDAIIDAYQCYGDACRIFPFRSSKPSPPEQIAG